VCNSSVSTLSFAEERSHDVSLRAPVRIENTFQLAPKQKFPASQIEVVVRQLLEEYLAHEQYKPELCRQMSKSLSEVLLHLEVLTAEHSYNSLYLVSVVILGLVGLIRPENSIRLKTEINYLIC